MLLLLMKCILTRLSQASFLWDIVKQNSPRCDDAKRGVPSGVILSAWRQAAYDLSLICSCWRKFIEIVNKNLKSLLMSPKSGLTRMITTGKSIHHIWVKTRGSPCFTVCLTITEFEVIRTRKYHYMGMPFVFRIYEGSVHTKM